MHIKLVFYSHRYVKNLASGGAVINKHIVKATATGIVKHYMPATHQSIEINDSWARSLLSRMQLVKRKGLFAML